MKVPKKVVPATEIKNRFGDYMGEVLRRNSPILVERHGKPAVVIVSFEEWRELRRVEEEESSPWIESLKRLTEEIDRNHPDTKPFSAVELVRQIREEEFE